MIHPLSLLHSDAPLFTPDISNMRRTGYAYNCSGSESRLADCIPHLTTECDNRIGVQCYNASTTTVSPSSSTAVSPSSTTTVSPNSSTIVSPSSSTPASPSSSTPTSPSSSTMVSPSTVPSRLQPSSPSRYIHGTSTVHHVTQSPLLQGTSPSKNLYPIYIYATIGIVTVLLLAIVGIVIVAIIMCRRSARKQLTSPQFAQNNDYVPEEESLYSNSKDHTMIEQTHEITQHHIYHEVAPPALHVYEEIAKAWYEQEGDYASLDRSTGPKARHNSDSTGNRELTTMQQQHSYSFLNHKDPPPVKGKPCVPQAVNQLSFLMSPIETNFVDSTDSTFPSDSNKPPTSAASNGVYGEQCGNHVYAILEDPSKCHTKSTSATHYPPQGEVVGGHQYAILEAPTINA